MITPQEHPGNSSPLSFSVAAAEKESAGRRSVERERIACDSRY
jgi:hypothetical protein